MTGIERVCVGCFGLLDLEGTFPSVTASAEKASTCSYRQGQERTYRDLWAAQI